MIELAMDNYEKIAGRFCRVELEMALLLDMLDQPYASTLQGKFKSLNKGLHDSGIDMVFLKEHKKVIQHTIKMRNDIHHILDERLYEEEGIEQRNGITELKIITEKDHTVGLKKTEGDSYEALFSKIIDLFANSENYMVMIDQAELTLEALREINALMNDEAIELKVKAKQPSL